MITPLQELAAPADRAVETARSAAKIGDRVYTRLKYLPALVCHGTFTKAINQSWQFVVGDAGTATTISAGGLMIRRAYILTLSSLVAAFSTSAMAQVVGADPQGSSPLLAALQWVQGTLLGNLATTAAVIAVAVVGYMMLTGRIEWRRGLMVVVGAFIIFGAVSIVAGIRQLAQGLH